MWMSQWIFPALRPSLHHLRLSCFSVVNADLSSMRSSRDVSTPIKDIPDVFTTYRKSIEPLRTRPRATLPKPEKGQLPPFPDDSQIPAQLAPFSIPTKYDEVEKAVLAPVRDFLPGMPPYPEGAESAHPFSGGETSAHERLRYLIKEGLMYSYKETRNGLLGPAFSTKLSAFLSQGCITARQIHHELVRYEDGTDPEYEHAKGFKEGENEGTTAVRFELLWRDYMRLCTKKFRHRLFSQDGFRDQEYANGNSASNSPGANSDSKKIKWKSPYKDQALADQTPSAEEIEKIIDRFNSGTTGMGLIDASQRELLHTGYTSNRARQNVASFLTKHLGIDWRFGAEWYEMLLVDYDVSSNWANWQYVAGVGNDPRGEARIFNPVKQAFDYDKDGAYVKTWVPEVQPLDKLENVFQVATTSPEDLEKAGNGLAENVMVTDPVKRIEFLVDGKPKTNKRPYHRARGPRRPSGYDGGARQLHTNGNGNVDRGSPSFRGRGGGGRRGGSGFYGGRGRGGTGIGMPGAFPGMYNHVAQGYFAGPPTAVQPMGGARGYHHGQHPMAARGGYQSAYPNPYVAGPPPPTG